MQAGLNPKKLYQEMELKRNKGFDLTLSQHLHSQYGGMTIDKLYSELQIDPTMTTVLNLLDRPDESIRWLVPEIFRDAIRLGFINSPIHKDFIIREEAVPQPTQIMPYWDMTNLPNAPQQIGAAESVPMGTIKYGQKTVRINKTGIGIEITDEAIQYTNISLLSIFLADVGVKLGSSLSLQAVQCLINGEQTDGSQSSAVVGVTNAAVMTFQDFVRMFVRGSLRNRKWRRTIGNEDMINYMMNMPAFQDRQINPDGRPQLGLNTKTVTTRDIEAYTHSSVPANQLVMVDPDMAMVQLTAQPLRVESERIVQRQISGTYATVTTGFATIFRDARVVVDMSQTFAGAPFPTWLAPLF